MFFHPSLRRKLDMKIFQESFSIWKKLNFFSHRNHFKKKEAKTKNQKQTHCLVKKYKVKFVSNLELSNELYLLIYLWEKESEGKITASQISSSKFLIDETKFTQLIFPHTKILKVLFSSMSLSQRSNKDSFKLRSLEKLTKVRLFLQILKKIKYKRNQTIFSSKLNYLKRLR